MASPSVSLGASAGTGHRRLSVPLAVVLAMESMDGTEGDWAFSLLIVTRKGSLHDKTLSVNVFVI
jgi:hypothetical protein